MYPCIWLTCSVLFLLLRARVETLSVSIGAVFDAPEFDEYSSLFYHTFNDNRLLRNTSLNVTAFATPIDPNKSVYSSLLSLCSSIEGSDTRVILVIGTEDTVQRVSQVAQPLGIPMLALTTDSNVERHVQVKKTTYFFIYYLTKVLGKYLLIVAHAYCRYGTLLRRTEWFHFYFLALSASLLNVSICISFMVYTSS